MWKAPVTKYETNGILLYHYSCVWMWELDHREGWAPKNWCFWTVVLEKAFESPLDCKEIKPVNPKGDQPWIFIRKTDAEVEALILWPPDVKSQIIGKRPWCWERLKAEGKEEGRGWDGCMASLTQWPWVWGNSNFHYLEDSEGQGSLVCGSPWVTKSQTTEQLNNSNNKVFYWHISDLELSV